MAPIRRGQPSGTPALEGRETARAVVLRAMLCNPAMSKLPLQSILAPAVIVLVGIVIAVQLWTWQALEDSSVEQARQDLALAFAVGRLGGLVSALETGPDEAEHARLVEMIAEVDLALDTLEDGSDEATPALATAREEAAAVASLLAQAREETDESARTRHRIGAGVHATYLARAQHQLSALRNQDARRWQVAGRRTTLALFGVILLCLPLAAAGFRRRRPEA